VGAERLQSERFTAQPLTENAPDGVAVVAHGRWRQAALVQPGGLNVAREAISHALALVSTTGTAITSGSRRGPSSRLKTGRS